MWNRMTDLKDWKTAEDGFLELLQKRNKWCTVSKTTWKNTDYDIELIKKDWTRITFEVKYDRLATKTGNVAFEIEYKWNPSGILTTKADYIVYLVDWIYYYTEANTLYDKIIEYEIVKWWDWYNSKLILITLQEFAKLFYSY